jgi:hypothetical protein
MCARGKAALALHLGTLSGAAGLGCVLEEEPSLIGRAAAHAVAAMRTHPASSSLAFSACCALRQLAEDGARAQNAVPAAGGLAAVVGALCAFPGDRRLQYGACMALVTLVDDHHANRGALGVAGGVEALCAALRAHASDAGVCRAAANALANATCLHGRNAARAVAAHAPRLLIASLVAHGTLDDDAAAAYMTCLALKNILMHDNEDLGVHAAFRLDVVDAGAVSAALRVLRHHPRVACVQQYGCGALCALYGTRAAVAAHGEAAALHGEALAWSLRVLREHEGAEAVAHEACCALASMVLTNAHRLAAVAAGAVPALLRALRAVEASAQPMMLGQGLTALEAVCRNTRRAVDEAAACGALADAVRLSGAHPGNAMLQHAALCLVHTLCEDVASNRPRAAAAGAMPRLLAAMRDHPNHAGLQCQACLALTSLLGSGAAALAATFGGANAAGGAAMLQAALAGGAPALCVRAMGTAAFPAHTLVRENAAAALLTMCRPGGGDGSPDPGADAALRSGALAVVLRLPPANAEYVPIVAALRATLLDAARAHDARPPCAAVVACALCERQRAKGALCALPGCTVRRAEGGAAAAPPLKLKRCAACGTASYCGVEHQRAHWATHRGAECAALAGARAALGGT